MPRIPDPRRVACESQGLAVSRHVGMEGPVLPEYAQSEAPPGRRVKNVQHYGTEQHIINPLLKFLSAFWSTTA